MPKALDGLELLEIEYEQAVKDGRVVEPTEYQAAQADVARARAAVAGHSGDGAVQAARHALRRVAVAVDRRVAPDALAREVAAARAGRRPQPFRRTGSVLSWLTNGDST